MAKPFEHPAYIPVPFALAVYRVTCNRAGWQDWELLDRYPRAQALQWIEAVHRANGWPRLADSMAWWGRELAKADN